MALSDKIWKKLLRLRLQPIRVFCFHQVSETFDESINCKPDWMSLSDFKEALFQLKGAGYHFISLQEAHQKISHNVVRFRKYAVLTADDGLQCQTQLLPWLCKNNIPLTLFCNINTLDGKVCGEQIKKYHHIQDSAQEKSLAKKMYINELALSVLNHPMLSIACHGYNHKNALKMTNIEFQKQVSLCVRYLSKREDYIPFYAYTFGAHSVVTDTILYQQNLVPVYMDGQKNYGDNRVIHRELLK